MAIKIKMWFPTIVIVVVGITQIESRNCSELSSVTNLKIARKDSSLAIEWTASNSTEECLEGYELCLSAISFENTNITCYNVSKNETSFSSNDDIYYCVEYKATLTVLGADGLRSRSSSGSLQAFPSTTIDPLVNLTKTANSSSIAITNNQNNLQRSFCHSQLVTKQPATLVLSFATRNKTTGNARFVIRNS
ncbi:unnamed protein product [Timema podura]|uniref:Fibronectin type-III domain-containing protein n=1 Tax=Timema podura TaxID=61482 RepID=A0ABN7NVB7_TIMPD|nr:unnamed protein product [Timema podura]